jgi:outer membrane receptor protein involved in Fe transport
VFQGTPAVFTRVRLGGGKQATTGFFGESNISLFSQTVVALGGRVDIWKNFDGFQASYLVGSPSVSSVDSNMGIEFSPRVGVTYQFAPEGALHAVAFRSFRAPTLNEMFRSFRVGNTTTNGNPSLKPEHNTGGEFGARYRLSRQFSTAISWFMNWLDKPVSNVTLDPNPANTIQQRQNLGQARILGLQTSLKWSPVPAVEVDLSHLWNLSRVTDFPANVALVDKRLPQVAEHRVTLKGAFSLPREFRLLVTGRFVDQQFDNDVNSVVLPSFAVWDANVSRSVGSTTRLFVAFENLTGANIVFNRSPVELLSTPFQVRGGLQFSIHEQ